MSCSITDLQGCAVQLVTDALGQMAKSLAESATYAVQKGTAAWLGVPTPDVDGAGSAAAWLSGRLTAFVAAAVFASVLWGAYRMATSGTFDTLADLGKSLARLFVVSGTVGVATTAALAVGDAISHWMLGDPEARLSALAVAPVFASPGLTIVIAMTVIVAQVVQVVLMLVKNAMVVMLVGFLPLTSAATNTPVGHGAFLKALTWLAAFVCYKPIAAIIYAVAFKMADRRQDLAGQLSGVALMCLSIVALPALMKFLAPITAAAAGGSAGAISGAIVGGAVATGAVVGAGALTGGGGFAAAAPALSAAPTGAQVGAAPAAVSTSTTDQGDRE